MLRFTYDGETISYNNETGNFATEISSIKHFGFDIEESFELVNPSNGNIITFTLHHMDYHDGEIVGWWYYPTNGHTKPTKLLVIND